MPQPFLKVLPAIKWYEGMMLTAQHFEENDLRINQIISSRLKLLYPYGYGLVLLKYDETLLNNNVFRIIDLQAVMPNGEIVEYSASNKNAQPLDINLKEYVNEGREFTVRLGISSEKQDLYSTEDLSISDDVINIPHLQPLLSLYVEEVSKLGMVDFPIIRFFYLGNILRQTSFVPPCFNFCENNPIKKEIISLVLRIQELTKKLTAKYKMHLGSPYALNIKDLMDPLFQTLPLLEMISQENLDHPYTWYLRFIDIIGRYLKINSFSLYPKIPRYDHEDLFNVFTALIKIANDLLNSIKDDYKLIPFYEKSGVFSLPVNLNTNVEKLFIGIKFKESTSTEAKRFWVNNAVITSDYFLEKIIKDRVTGAHRSILDFENFPQGLYTMDDVVIDCKVDDIHMKRNGQIIVFNPMDEDKAFPISVYLCILDGDMACQ